MNSTQKNWLFHAFCHHFYFFLTFHTGYRRISKRNTPTSAWPALLRVLSHYIFLNISTALIQRGDLWPLQWWLMYFVKSSCAHMPLNFPRSTHTLINVITPHLHFLLTPSFEGEFGYLGICSFSFSMLRREMPLPCPSVPWKFLPWRWYQTFRAHLAECLTLTCDGEAFCLARMLLWNLFYLFFWVQFTLNSWRGSFLEFVPKNLSCRDIRYPKFTFFSLFLFSFCFDF